MMVKEIVEFHKDKLGIMGCRASCKCCDLELKRLKYASDPEKARAQNKEWRIANPDKNLAIRKASYQQRKKWMSEKYKNDSKYREKIKARVQKYRDDPLTKDARRKTRQMATKKQKSNPKYRLACNLRRRLSFVLNGKRKEANTFDLVGCSRSDFLRHIESLFQENMTWENYGVKGWVMDHIIPCCSFDLLLEEEQRKCFHYTNIRPLWYKDNAAKGAEDRRMKLIPDNS